MLNTYDKAVFCHSFRFRSVNLKVKKRHPQDSHPGLLRPHKRPILQKGDPGEVVL